MFNTIRSKPEHILITLCLAVSTIIFGYVMMIRAVVKFTLTATHLQQHLYKGGWVTQWCNIEKIGHCFYTDKDGWQHPLPWVGIKLKNYSPYLESICPRIITEILFNQRSLLYLGAKQKKQTDHFEDMVLDSKSSITSHGERFEGLQAMLANRMQYQRGYYDYDIFIPENDLDRPVEEFIGLNKTVSSSRQSLALICNKRISFSFMTYGGLRAMSGNESHIIS